MKDGFVERDEIAEPRLERSRLFVQFVAEKRVAHFGAKGVARSEAGRDQTKGPSGGQGVVPDRPDDISGRHDFKSLLARVTGARAQDRACAALERPRFGFFAGRQPWPPACLRKKRPGNNLVDELSRFRPLNGDGFEAVGRVS